jgi:hypothetical protein
MTFSMAVITRTAGHLVRDQPAHPVRFVPFDPEEKWDDENKGGNKLFFAFFLVFVPFDPEEKWDDEKKGGNKFSKVLYVMTL